MSLFAKLRLFFYLSLLVFLFFAGDFFYLPKDVFLAELLNCYSATTKKTLELDKDIKNTKAKIPIKEPKFILKGILGTVLSNDSKVYWSPVKLNKGYHNIVSMNNSFALIQISKELSLIMDQNTKLSIDNNNCINISQGCIQVKLQTLKGPYLCIDMKEEPIFSNKVFCAKNSKMSQFIEKKLEFKASLKQELKTTMSEDWLAKNVKSNIKLVKPNNDTVYTDVDPYIEFVWTAKRRYPKCKIFISSSPMFYKIIYESLVRGERLALNTPSSLGVGSFFWKLSCAEDSSPTGRFFIYNSNALHITEPRILNVSYDLLPIKIEWIQIAMVKHYNLLLSTTGNFTDIISSVSTHSNYVYIEKPSRGLYYLKLVAVFKNNKTIESKILKFKVR